MGDEGSTGSSGGAGAEFSFSSSAGSRPFGFSLMLADSLSAFNAGGAVLDLRGCSCREGERTPLRLLEAFLDSRLETPLAPSPGWTGFFFSPAPGCVACDGDGCGAPLLGLAGARFANGQMLMLKGRTGSARASHMGRGREFITLCSEIVGI